MRVTRRGLFATVAAAIAARFLPKPKMVATGWSTGCLKPGDVVTIDGVYFLNPRGLFRLADAAEAKLRAEAFEDLKFLEGDTWPA